MPPVNCSPNESSGSLLTASTRLFPPEKQSTLPTTCGRSARRHSPPHSAAARARSSQEHSGGERLSVVERMAAGVGSCICQPVEFDKPMSLIVPA
jgi:hypothetical protein